MSSMIKNLSLFFLQYVALELDSKYSVLNGARVCSLPQSCLTLGDPLTVVHQAPLSIGILQARIPKWVAMPSSRGSSQPRDWACISCLTDGFFTTEPLGKPWAGRTNQYRWRECWNLNPYQRHSAQCPVLESTLCCLFLSFRSFILGVLRSMSLPNLLF